jgi:hypothetical protein
MPDLDGYEATKEQRMKRSKFVNEAILKALKNGMREEKRTGREW